MIRRVIDVYLASMMWFLSSSVVRSSARIASSEIVRENYKCHPQEEQQLLVLMLIW